jgi:hypothetical protein
MTAIDPILYERCLAHFAEVAECKFVVKNAIPIPYFGDLKAYLASSLKIVTVALNPSDREFPQPDDLKFKGHRFDLSASTPLALEKTLSEYFSRLPYSGWFMSFERVLNGVGFSYGGKLNRTGVIGGTALHLDLCSPIATNPTWSGLSVEQKLTLTSEGHAIFGQLMEALKPDLVVASMAWSHLTSYDPISFPQDEPFEEVYSCTERKTAKGIRPKLSVSAKKMNIAGSVPTTFVHASAFRGPFGQFNRDERRIAGEHLAAFMGLKV